MKYFHDDAVCRTSMVLTTDPPRCQVRRDQGIGWGAIGATTTPTTAVRRTTTTTTTATTPAATVGAPTTTTVCGTGTLVGGARAGASQTGAIPIGTPGTEACPSAARGMPRPPVRGRETSTPGGGISAPLMVWSASRPPWIEYLSLRLESL